MSSVAQIDSARTPLSYARRYARMGWHVIPLWWAEPTDGGKWRCACGSVACTAPAKHPISAAARQGQNSATTDEAQIERWWSQYPRANVGIVLALSNLVAIDIDPRNGGDITIEEVEVRHGPLRSDVLQLTGGGGEHRVFQVPAGVMIQVPGKLGPGVDVKHNGYIVVEPSNHICGGTYQWEASSDPLDGVLPSVLPDWVRSVRPEHLPQEPQAKVLSATEVLELQSALAVIDPDARGTWLNVGMALHATDAGPQAYGLWCDWSRQSEKFDPVDQQRVWRSFRTKGLSGLSPAWIFSEAQSVGWVNPRSRAAQAAAAPVVDPALAETLTPKRVQPAAAAATGDLDRLPVTQLDRAAGWISGLYDQPTPAISVAGALALASVVTGRVYRSEMANWPSLLMAIVGPSGVGKNYVKVGIERLLVHAGLDRLIAGDFYTHQSALYWALHQAPCHICISDEFGENFLEARKNNNANKMTVFKALKKVYSDADHIYKPESYSMGGLSKKQREEMEQRPVANPAITMLGLSTARQFWGEIKASHIEGGLLNRFVIVTVDGSRGEIRGRGPDEPPAELIEHIRAVRRIDEFTRHTAYDAMPSWVPVRFSDGARRRFEAMRALADALGDRLEAHGLGPMTRRWRENAMRMATGLSAFERPADPVVHADLADWACRYIEARGQEAIEQLGANAGETDYAHQLNAVRAFIGGAGERGATDYELKRGINHIRRRDLAELVAHLAEAGAIVQVERRSDKGGRPSQAWVIAQAED